MRTDLNNECKELETIIENIVSGKETFDTEDARFTLDAVIEYLRDYLHELKNLNVQITEHGNTPELLKTVYDKYTELWLFQGYCNVDSLPRVIGSLWRYPDDRE